LGLLAFSGDASQCRAYKKDGDRLFSRASYDRTIKEGRFRLYIRKKYFSMRVMKHLNRLSREGRCPILGNIQGRVGRGSEQPDLAEDVPAHCREGGLNDPISTQSIL